MIAGRVVWVRCWIWIGPVTLTAYYPSLSIQRIYRTSKVDQRCFWLCVLVSCSEQINTYLGSLTLSKREKVPRNGIRLAVQLFSRPYVLFVPYVNWKKKCSLNLTTIKWHVAWWERDLLTKKVGWPLTTHGAARLIIMFITCSKIKCWKQ